MQVNKKKKKKKKKNNSIFQFCFVENQFENGGYFFFSFKFKMCWGELFIANRLAGGVCVCG